MKRAILALLVSSIFVSPTLASAHLHSTSRHHAAAKHAKAHKFGSILQGWQGYGGDAQHTGQWTAGSQPLQSVHWKASMDDDRAYYGSEVLIHYASPCITPANTVVYSHRANEVVNTTTTYDNWRVIARDGGTGSVIWRINTGYSAPVVYPADWTSVYPMSLSAGNQLALADNGGTLLVRNADLGQSAPFTRVVWYTTLKDYEYVTGPTNYSPIKICTPITGDKLGGYYFGYLVESNSSIPSNVATALGTGGFVHVFPNKTAAFVSVGALNVDSALVRPALNASPAVSNDGKSFYGAVCDNGQGTSYLVQLDSTTLALKNSVHLMDPAVNQGVSTINESSASPMVGPDGHVFYGVFAYYWRESHGWMLQFDANLNPNDANGKKWPTGGFGWDDTAVVVPSSIVPSYTGTATYLILTKYNNYALNSGDGLNRVAIIDPTSDSTSIDRQQGIPIMNVIISVLGPSPDPQARENGFPNAVHEWCINSAAVDIANKSAIVNSEDGHMYRWSFVTNKLTQPLLLAPATGEAYTCTCIGPDGTVYAINNSILCAVGSTVPSAAKPHN